MPARLLILLVSTLVMPLAQADIVRLKNGDRLSGSVVAKHDGALVLKTAYAGEVRIPWSEVTALEIEQPVAVMLKDGDPAPARIAATAPGRATLIAADGTRSEVALSRIDYINPTPFQSGTGIAWSGHVNVAATIARGNASNDQVYGEARVEGRAKQFRFAFGGKVNRASDEGGTTANSWLVDGNYDRFLRPRHFVYARGSLERDRFKDVDHRLALGVGYGWQVAESADRSLSLRGGVDFVQLERSVGSDERYPALGWGVRYEEWMFARRFRVFHEQEGFWNTEDFSDVVVRTKTGVRVPVYAGVDATAQLNLDWDSAPSPDRDELDSVWLLGLAYKW